MIKNFLFLVATASVFIFSGCETDIDINADYEDITVVYSAINPSDTTHYIKINKAFSGESNALDLAANADNFTYAADELAVAVEEYDENYDLVNTYTVTRTENEVPKESGIFDNSTNVLYKFTAAGIDRNNTFKVVIFNNDLNKTISGETKIVKPIAVTDPAIGSKFTFWNGSVATGNSITDNIGVQSSPNVGRF